MFGKEKDLKITIDEQKCISCGKCVDICFDHLEMVNKKVKENPNSTFGCIQCGHCMMLCPQECIFIESKYISKDKIAPLAGNKPHFDDLFYMFKKRRSIRQFKEVPVDQAMIEQIIDAGTTAPMGLPPSDVKILVFNGKEKVQAFADDLCESFEEVIKFFNPIVLASFKPIMGKVQHEMFKDFIIPLLKKTVEMRKKGKDILFYNAPTVMVFYTGKYSSTEDAVLASTYSQIAAETLNLGSCVIGSVAPSIEKSKKLRTKYGIEKTDKIQTSFILGHPVKEFNRSIKRVFKDVKYI